MLAPEQAFPEFTLPAIDVRALARRAAVPALLVAATASAVLVFGGRIHGLEQVLRRILHGDPAWGAAGITLECISLAGYVALLSLVGSRATSRIRLRESAQITLAGAAATRLLPTAGAGGAALTVWALRRAGLKTSAAARTLLVFFVLLYAVFLGVVVVAGAMLALGLSRAAHGPTALSAIPAAAAALAIVAALSLGRSSRAGGRLQLVAVAVADAKALVRSRDPRLAGAAAYWLCDAAVLLAMLHAFGTPPALTVVALAYFVGQVANTIPLPGSVSGGMAGVLIAFGVPAALALPAVLAYRTIAVWLPTPAAVAAIPRLRRTTAAWARADA